MIKKFILLALCVFLTLVSLSQVDQSKQVTHLKNIMLYALKHNKPDTLSSVILGDNKNSQIIKNAWVKICNEVPYNDTSRIDVDIYSLGEISDTVYLLITPYFWNSKPIEQSFETYSPVYKLIKKGKSLLIDKIIFVNQEIDHISYNTKVTISPKENYADVNCKLDFKIRSGCHHKAVLNLYPDLSIKELQINNKKVDYAYRFYSLIISIPSELKNSDTLHMDITYDGKINDEDYMFILENEGLLCFRPWLPNANNLTEYWLNTENAFTSDEYTQNYEITIPSEFYSIADFGKLTDSKVTGNQRTEKWEAPKSDHIGIIYGKWSKYEVKPIGNIKPTIYLTKNSEALHDTLTKVVNDLVSFYSNTFGEPSNKSFRIVDSPVYWNCDNYIASNLGIIDHEMAHYWWLSDNMNWFFHGLTEFSIALFYEKKYGQKNLEKRLMKYWCDYYAYVTSNPNALLSNNAMLVYYLGPLMHYHLMMDMGRENYLKMCRKLIATNYDRKNYSYNDLLNLIKDITNQDYGWFFEQWRNTTVKPKYEIAYKQERTGDQYDFKGIIHEKSKRYRSNIDVRVITCKDTVLKTVLLSDSLTSFDIKLASPIEKIELNPSNSLLAYRTKAIEKIVDFTSKEVSLNKEKRWDTLISLCDSIIKYYPSGWKWYKAKAGYQTKNNQLREAKVSLENALKYFDTTVERLDMKSSIYLELGKTCDLLNERDQAISYYNKIINSMNSRPEAKAMAINYLNIPYSLSK